MQIETLSIRKHTESKNILGSIKRCEHVLNMSLTHTSFLNYTRLKANNA